MVISLPRDANRITVIGGVSSADGVTPVTIYVDPVTHRMLVDNGGGGGTVVSVSGTSPIIIDNTDPANPIVTIQVASGAQNGYLSSSDWTTFNGKQAAISLTTTGSSGASTFVANTLNIPNYTLAGLGGANTALSNLAAVAINTTLVSDTTNTDDLGTSGVTWRTGYFGTSLLIGATNTITATTSDLSGGALTLGALLGAIDAGGATSLEIPNGAAPTVNADGEIAVDTTVADFSHGLIKFYSGEEQGVVSMPVAEFTSPQDGDVVTYNATADEFQLQQPSGGGSTCLTSFPQMNGLGVDPSNTEQISAKGMSINTTQYLGQVVVPIGIVANSITVRCNGNTNTPGTIDLTLYAEDGQSQLFSVTTGTINASGLYTTAISSVTIPAGNYYIGANTNGTADIQMFFYTSNDPDSGSTGVNNMAVVSGKPTLQGSMTITASTPAATFTPSSSLTYSTQNTIMFRLDN